MMRAVFAGNTNRLMARYYRNAANQPKALAKDAGVSLSTVQRILDGKTGATLDNIEAIAGAFRLSAYQLLVPNIDPADPPIVAGAIQAEQKMRRTVARLRDAASEPAAQHQGREKAHA